MWPRKLAGGVQLAEGLAQVNDVDAVAGVEDERLHLGVPPPGLVPEMDAGIQQFLNANTNHKFSFGLRVRPYAGEPSRGTRD